VQIAYNWVSHKNRDFTVHVCSILALQYTLCRHKGRPILYFIIYAEECMSDLVVMLFVVVIYMVVALNEHRCLHFGLLIIKHVMK